MLVILTKGLCVFCFQDLTDDIFFFYLMEMALYVSLLISVCVDVKRKVENNFHKFTIMMKKHYHHYDH